ncbi:MAG: helix-turn-helix transcriptional regulator, partial [Betaproteobacteria bacterium]
QEPTDMIIKPPNEPTLLRRPQVEQRTGLSRSSLYEYITDGRFPPPVPLGPRAVGWLESEVSDWINARVKLARQSRTPAAR